MTIVRAIAVLGVLTACFALAAMQPLVLWTRVCATPSLTKEDCSAEGKARATDSGHMLRALRHPFASAQLTVRMLLP